MPSDKPEREKVEGREVWVTKDESGVTSVAEEKEAADPSVGTDHEDDDGDDGDGEQTEDTEDS
jgi:hypothetical protein